MATMKIVFASNNRHKLKEISTILNRKFTVLSLKDIGCNAGIPETSDTLQGNALQKAEFVYTNYGYDCFADDTGLEIEALEGRPGVFSARYAGELANFEDNIRKVLNEMKYINHRNASFKTSIALILHGNKHFFHGEIKGKILEEKRGHNGFGYDPIFVPEGYNKSFAELDETIKNSISHRAIATKKMADFLQSYFHD